jgi:hypothetical protein
MDTEKVITSIDNQIAKLNERRILFKKTTILKDLNKIDDMVVLARRDYNFTLIFAIILTGILYIAALALLIDRALLNWSHSGILIVFTLTSIFMAWIKKIEYDRLRMIQYLIELKNKFKK